MTLNKEIKLFNGKNLNGWVIYGTEKWYVEDGLLISESGPDKEYGYLGTKKNYKDFELNLEFKQEADGNSGVFIRSTVDGTKVSGWQVEVAPPGHDTGGIYESYGRGWLIKPDKEKDSVLKFGDWNKMKIFVKGDRVTSYLNDVEMVDYTDSKIGQGEGGILLQIHDGGGIKVYWKNITLKPL
ncbi:3-keto-disaccharide hydrolase [Mongoliibacter ruber]